MESCEKQIEESTQKMVLDNLEMTKEQVIGLFYHIEHLILKNNSVPDEIYKRLNALKDLITSYKVMLNKPNPDKLDLPEDFVKEYTHLKARAREVIAKTNEHLETLSKDNNNNLFIQESSERLQKLTLLYSHYKTALEIT